jgi:hypothetical protein
MCQQLLSDVAEMWHKVLHIISSSCCFFLVVNYIYNFNVLLSSQRERDCSNTNNSFSLNIFVKEPTVNRLNMSKLITKALRHCCGVANTVQWKYWSLFVLQFFNWDSSNSVFSLRTFSFAKQGGRKEDVNLTLVWNEMIKKKLVKTERRESLGRTIHRFWVKCKVDFFLNLG